LFSLIIHLKKSAKNKISRRYQRLCLLNLPNGIFLSHSIGVKSLLNLFHRGDECNILAAFELA
jgi:hypothetical protein